jgi:hypothetical protein
MTIKPCLWCHRKRDCGIKRDKLKAVRGAGLTQIVFKCPIPEQDFPPGCFVRALLKDRTGFIPRIPVQGVLMKHWRKGVLICLDEDSRDGFNSEPTGPEDMPQEVGDVISVRTERLTRLSIPGVRVCKGCGYPEGRHDLKRRDGSPWGTCEDCDMLPAPEAAP